MVRFNDYEQLKLIGGAVRVLHNNLRTSEGAWLWLLWSGDGDVVVLVRLNSPALVDVLLIQLDLGFEALFALLLR